MPREILLNGRPYKVNAIHLSEPSPQRTPLLYQAGSSWRGRPFAATHAECWSDFARFVVPELQARGAFKAAHRTGTLRDKLFGRARLPASHPAMKPPPG